jgi:hypothetical protein
MVSGGSGGRSILGRLVSAAVALSLIAWVVKDPTGAASTARHLRSLASVVVDGLSSFVSHLMA